MNVTDFISCYTVRYASPQFVSPLRNCQQNINSNGRFFSHSDMPMKPIEKAVNVIECSDFNDAKFSIYVSTNDQFFQHILTYCFRRLVNLPKLLRNAKVQLNTDRQPKNSKQMKKKKEGKSFKRQKQKKKHVYMGFSFTFMMATN